MLGAQLGIQEKQVETGITHHSAGEVPETWAGEKDPCGCNLNTDTQHTREDKTTRDLRCTQLPKTNSTGTAADEIPEKEFFYVRVSMICEII